MVDVNKPVENQLLVAALRQAHFLLVLHEALKHDEPDADGKITLKEKTRIFFPMLSPPEGAPTFTTTF